MDINYYKKYEPIDGKWYITKELGSGAFGKVFEVERRDFTNAKSALKIISIPSSTGELMSYRQDNYDLDERSVSAYFYGFVEEFVKEFEVMIQIKGQNNVVHIEDYDVKEHEGEIGWDIFIRMELLTPMNIYFANKTLHQKDVVKLGIDICKALEACQKFNIVHRDIKPSNIFISDTGEYKLGDFGVARTLEKTSSGLSKKGTEIYMAPEVYKAESYNSNVDTYSLGIVMYKLLNNNMEPFRREKTHTDEVKALEARLIGEPMPKPANADGKLAEIILKACAFDPKDRYISPLQMRKKLEELFVDMDFSDEEIAVSENEFNDNEDNVVEFVPENEIPTDSISDDGITRGIFDEIENGKQIEDDGLTISIFGDTANEMGSDCSNDNHLANKPEGNPNESIDFKKNNSDNEKNSIFIDSEHEKYGKKTRTDFNDDDKEENVDEDPIFVRTAEEDNIKVDVENKNFNIALTVVVGIIAVFIFIGIWMSLDMTVEVDENDEVYGNVEVNSDPVVIANAEAHITGFYAGNTPNDVKIYSSKPDAYEVTLDCVSCWNSGSSYVMQNYEEIDAEVFGKDYWVDVTFSFKHGYCADDNTKFDISGYPVHVTSVVDEHIVKGYILITLP